MAGPSPEEIRAYYANASGGMSIPPPLVSMPPPAPLMSQGPLPVSPMPDMSVMPPPQMPGAPAPTASPSAADYYASLSSQAPAPPQTPAEQYYAGAPATPPTTTDPGNPFAAGASVTPTAPMPDAPVSLPFSRTVLPHKGETPTAVKPAVTSGAAALNPFAKASPALGTGAAGASDPFGKNKAQNALLGTYAAEQEGTRKLATIESDREMQRAEMKSRLAQEQADDSVIEQATASAHRESFERDMNDVRSQLDAVKSKKIDLLKIKDEEGGGPIASVLGGLFGGLYQGLNHMQSNPFFDRLDRKVSERIKFEEDQIGRSRTAAIDQLNLVGQLRSVFKDEDMARQQARAMYYQAAQQQIEAKMADYESPAIRARGELGINTIERAKADLQVKIAAQAEARAAAAGAQRRAQLEKDRENELKWYEAHTHRVTANAEAESKGGKAAERFVATGQDAQGNPTGYVARDKESAQKEEDKRSARAAIRQSANEALAIREEQGAVGRTVNRSNPDQAIQLYTPEWQTKLRGLSSQITMLENKGGGLGAYDNGTAMLLSPLVGDLESRGGSSDVKLRQLLKHLDEADQIAEKHAGGAGARKVVGPDGREAVELSGAQSSPQNARTVKREAP